MCAIGAACSIGIHKASLILNLSVQLISATEISLVSQKNGTMLVEAKTVGVADSKPIAIVLNLKTIGLDAIVYNQDTLDIKRRETPPIVRFAAR